MFALERLAAAVAVVAVAGVVGHRREETILPSRCKLPTTKRQSDWVSP